MTAPLTPPYPADTRAKGWRFELDYEKIDQSDTWGLAAEVPLARPCLVMMWLVAWTQEPCGSLPNDESIIRARCSIPANIWPKVRELLMRGWWLASDGRLYHDTVAQRVLEMIDYRKKNAQRVANFKLAQREQQAGNALPDRDSRDKNDTGTGTGTSSTPTVQKKAKARKSAPISLTPADLAGEGFGEELAAEFITCKASRGAPLTARAWADHLREAEKAGWTPLAAAEKVMAKTWKGFEAKYVAAEPPSRSAVATAKSFRQNDLEAKRAEVAAWTGGRLGRAPANTIDMEVPNGAVKLVG